MKNMKIFSSIDLSLLLKKDYNTVIKEIRMEREILGYYEDILQEFRYLTTSNEVIPYILFTKKGCIHFLNMYKRLEEIKRIELIDASTEAILNDFYNSFLYFPKKENIKHNKAVKDKSTHQPKSINYKKKFFSITEICQPFDIGPTKTNELLATLGIIHKYKGTWVLSPKYHNLGKSLNSEYYHNQMVNYGKTKLRYTIGGLKYIRKILKTHGYKEKADK